MLNNCQSHPHARQCVNHMRERLFRMGTYAVSGANETRMTSSVRRNLRIDVPSQDRMVANAARNEHPEMEENRPDLGRDELTALMEELMDRPINQLEEERTYR